MPPSKKHISYKPAAVAKRRTTDTPIPTPPLDVGALLCLPERNGLERLHISLPPGSTLLIDCALSHGHVTVSYPLDADPCVTVDAGEGPVEFTFQRNRAMLELMEGNKKAGN